MWKLLDVCCGQQFSRKRSAACAKPWHLSNRRSDCHQSNYKYNSLQATVRKQLSHGLQFQGSYTWSRSFIQQPFGINSYPYFDLQYGLNPNYRPHRFVVSYVWGDCHSDIRTVGKACWLTVGAGPA